MEITRTEKCRFCGAPFKASRGGTTVHCPEHRTPESRRRERVVEGPREVAPAGRTCTVRSVFGPCGKPAVFAFVASTGEVFAECEEHHR